MTGLWLLLINCSHNADVIWNFLAQCMSLHRHGNGKQFSDSIKLAEGIIFCTYSCTMNHFMKCKGIYIGIASLKNLDSQHVP